jgi:uncharacterized MAPEG superfamily protein
MTIELWMLVWAIVLTFVQMLIAVQGATIQVGLTTLAGNREDMPALSGWKGRADRSYRNMREYLLLFAALVLVAHVANATSSLSALGAQIFLYARVVYAVVYLIGIPWLRTGVWAVSVVGMVLIAIAIFQVPSAA